jgi:hypothetical protein
MSIHQRAALRPSATFGVSALVELLLLISVASAWPDKADEEGRANRDCFCGPGPYSFDDESRRFEQLTGPSRTRRRRCV